MPNPLALRTRAALLTLLVGSALCLANIAMASVQPPPGVGYPRLAFYGSIRGTGYPFILPDSSLDWAVIDKVSRFEEIILDVNPVFPYRPDVLTALRSRNPRAKMLAYVVGQAIWDARDRDSLVHYPTRYRRIVDNNNGRLYSKKTGGEYFAGNVNLAKRNAAGELIVADSLALLWRDVSITPGIWDGIFYDILCDEMGWPQTKGDSINFIRAGYNSFPEFNASWSEATDSIATRMRRWGGDDFIIVGNCALGTKYSTFNGWMREGFPRQGGGDWYSNMFQEPGGYITDDRNFRQPRHNYIFSFQVGSDYRTYTNARIMRFGLGSATMGDGYGVFGGSDRDAFHADYHNWWYDEYGVNLDGGGVASEDRNHTGWLGQPLTDLQQVIWIDPSVPDGITNPGFEQNLTGWGFSTLNGSTIARDGQASAPTGFIAARVDVPNPDPVEWKTTLRSATPFPVLPFNTYSVTFWARATSPRNIPVVLARYDNHQMVMNKRINLTTEWKQYQVPFLMEDYEGDASLELYLGKDGGSVWFDDVHLQQGSSVVYRRDFQNGIVLVNPSRTSYVSVPLERDYKKILGVIDPYTNDGSVSNVMSLAPEDALFLIGDDVHAPATVTDLRAIPVRP